MQYKIHHEGTFPLLEVSLTQGEAIKAESGAMVTMSSTVDIEGKIEGGIMKGLGRMLAGEKFFFQTLSATRGSGVVTLAPAPLGQIVPLELNGKNYIVQKDGFLAGTTDITIDTKMQNLAKGLFSGEGFFVVKIGGTGTVFVNSYGAIHEVNIPAGEEMTIDNGHLVAWEDNINYRIDKASKGWISSVTSGEALVCKFTGPGKVLIQTRNPASFASWIGGMLPSK